MNRTGEHAAADLKQFYQTHTPDIVVWIMKEKIVSWKKQLIKQKVSFIYSERIWENDIHTVAVERNLTYRLDVVIE